MKTRLQNDLFDFFSYAQKHLSESESNDLRDMIITLTKLATDKYIKIKPTKSPTNFKIIIDNDAVFYKVFESLSTHVTYRALVESFEVEYRHRIA